MAKGTQILPRHLVDGVPMLFYQRRVYGGDKHWYARWREGKRWRARYFGVEDPRPNYEIYESEGEL